MNIFHFQSILQVVRSYTRSAKFCKMCATAQNNTKISCNGPDVSSLAAAYPKTKIRQINPGNLKPADGNFSRTDLHFLILACIFIGPAASYFAGRKNRGYLIVCAAELYRGIYDLLISNMLKG